MLLKQLWTVVWSLDSLLFVEKKKQKINCKTSRAHTKYCSAHERQNVLRRTTSSVEMKLTMTRTRRQTQRKHNTPYYPLSTHTHTHACAFTTPGSLSVCECLRVCVRVWDSAHTFAAVLVAVFPAVALSKCSLSLPPLSLRYSRLLSVWRKIDSVFRWVIWYEEILFEHAIGL